MAIDKLRITTTDFSVNSDSGFSLKEENSLEGVDKFPEHPILIEKSKFGLRMRHGEKAVYNDDTVNITCRAIASVAGDTNSPLMPLMIINCNPNKIVNGNNHVDAEAKQIDDVLKFIPHYLQKIGVNVSTRNLKISRFDVGLSMEMLELPFLYIKLLLSAKKPRTLKSRNYQGQTGLLYNKSRKILFYDKFEELKSQGFLMPDRLRNLMRYEAGYLTSYYTKKLNVRGYEDYQDGWRRVAKDVYDLLLKNASGIREEVQMLADSKSVIARLQTLKGEKKRYKTQFMNELATVVLLDLFGKEGFLDVMKELDCHRQTISDVKKDLDASSYNSHEIQNAKMMKKEIIDNVKNQRDKICSN